MKFPLRPAKSRPQRVSNSQSSDSESDTLSVGPCGYVSCQLYLLLVRLPSVVPCIESISKNFLCVKQKVDYKRIRSPNLLLRSQTPYSLGHLAMYPVTCICYLFSCQVLSLVLTSFVRSFLCVKQKVDHRGIRTPNLLIWSQTPNPLGHAAMYPVNCICYLFSCQVLSIVLTPFRRIFLFQAKSRPQRISNPQSFDSKSDTLPVSPFDHVSCQLYLLLVQLPSVVPCFDSISMKFPLCPAKSRPQRDSNSQSSDLESDT